LQAHVLICGRFCIRSIADAGNTGRARAMTVIHRRIK
jgi:hypothetical protein